MKDPRSLSIRDFTYSLPEGRIARYPLSDRDASKLLIYRQGKISEDIYRNIANHLPNDSLLVFNNTKVVEARLLFKKPSGGVIEIFCLEPHEQYSDITTAMMQKEKVLWHCLVGGASKWKRGQILSRNIERAGETIVLQGKYIEKKTDGFIVELSWKPAEKNFAEILHLSGATPLPPYIKREADESDKERYQTVYARTVGSVAAPTAGLHFTEYIFQQLKEKNIQTGFITLHVGAGTFKPVKTESIGEHEMHAEWIDVSKDTIEKILANLDKDIVAVGTTSLRTIESLYWIGMKSAIGNRQSANESERSESLSQWEAYQMSAKNLSPEDALYSLLDWMKQNKMERLVARTQILIAPGYEFKIVKGLITNFHQPQSTLLLLIAAFIGKDWRNVYDYAMKNDFRFLSYGDGCLLWIDNNQ